MKMTGAQAIMQALVHEQVDIVFGYPGGAIMPLYDALFDFKDQVHHVLVRHEQGAVHAAEGYARACGKPGVCIATSGPGATNLITGITDAMMDSVPLVCITGQVGSLFLGTDAFQEADILSMTVPVTKWSVQVTSAKEIPACLAKAFYLAKSGRPGPVVVDITKDAQLGTLDFSYPRYEGKAERGPQTRFCRYSGGRQVIESIISALSPCWTWGIDLWRRKGSQGAGRKSGHSSR